MEQELYLTDLISVDTLQYIQDAFSNMTGMSAVTADLNGVPVTRGSNFTEFCMKYARTSQVGHIRCEQCDKFGAEVSWKKGGPTSYICHAGLVDYAAPILANGKMIGSFIGGQVLTKAPNREKVQQVAKELGVDADKLWEAVEKVKILDKRDIDKAAQFLYAVATVLSNMAYGRHMAIEASREIEKANSMKSDFLANMSHEIRTPMNAVVGMAEMALREDLPSVARDCIHQIKASSKTLLTIINDILDFSKIESGKMDIIPVEYEPMSIINDISNIVMERIRDKDVELILEISPDIPHRVIGDNIRINQILLNIVNNAIKFTNKGKVAIKMVHKPIDEDKVLLQFSVEDTGIGIKQKNLEKIFNSFQQVDSKRNRNVEGTGLGLAISQQLTTLMGGSISVESEYEKGSIFSFEIPQQVVEITASCKVKRPESVRAMGMFCNHYLEQQVSNDCVNLGVEYKKLTSLEEAVVDKEKDSFLFVDQDLFTQEVEEFVKANMEEGTNLTTILLFPFEASADYGMTNLLMMKKPLYILNETMIFNKEGLYLSDMRTDVVDMNFIAPKAEVLVVDDNAINLTVAEGLLEPLQMKIDTALSGTEAVEKISLRHYDLIFMDHMMPEIDGVETTRLIRRFHPEYNDVPIIALTANAVSGTKEMLLKEGMNDFIAKPIELNTLIAKVAQWLPVEKVEKTDGAISNTSPDAEEEIVVGDLDTKTAIKMLGNAKLFWTVLKDYYRVIEKKANLILELYRKEDWAAYTIEVHALKSASKQVGAMSLSDKAALMEKAGNARDTDVIRAHIESMLSQYRSYIPVLAPFFEEENEGGESGMITDELLSGFFADMRAALEELDIDQMESVSEAMGHYSYREGEDVLFERLKEAVANIDIDACEEIMKEWEVVNCNK